MNSVADVLKSEREEDCRKRVRRSRWIKSGFMASAFLFRFGFHIVDVIKMFMDPEKFLLNESLYLNISLSCRIPYLVLFLMAILLWFHLLRFFVYMKSCRSILHFRQKMNIIVAVIFSSLLCSYHIALIVMGIYD